MPAHSLAVMPATLEITNGLVMGEGVAQRILQTNVVRRFIAAQFAGITIMEIQEGLDTRTAHRFAISDEKILRSSASPGDRGSARYTLIRLAERGKVCNVGSQKRQVWVVCDS